MSKNNQIIGIIPFDEFKSTVDSAIQQFFQQNNAFCIVVIDFSIKDKNSPFPFRSFVEYIAKNIQQKLLNEDCFSTDNGSRFYIFLPQVSKHFATITMASLVGELRQEIGNLINVNFGIAECPEDGSSFSELLESVESSLNRNSQYNVEQNINIQDEKVKRGLHKTFTNIQDNVKAILFRELYSMLKNITEYDSYLGEHTALVTKGSVMLAKEFGLPWKEVEKIAIAALLHDIGYTAIPRETFLKKGALTPEEWKVIRMHPIIASEQILKPIVILNDYIPYVQDHHEYLDGSGYPRGRKGDVIPIGAQIISVIDSYQAMIVDRPYRKALNFEEILNVYIRNAGIKWENSVITMFTAMIADPKMRQKLSDKSNFSLSMILSQNGI